MYTSEPLEDEHGDSYVIRQQNVGPGSEAGGGEWPDPATPPSASPRNDPSDDGDDGRRRGRCRRGREGVVSRERSTRVERRTRVVQGTPPLPPLSRASMATMAADATTLRDARVRTARLVTELSGVFAEIVDVSALANLDDEHDPEGATVAFERAQVFELLERARAQLREVDAGARACATGPLRHLRTVRGADSRRAPRGAAGRPVLRRLRPPLNPVAPHRRPRAGFRPAADGEPSDHAQPLDPRYRHAPGK